MTIRRGRSSFFLVAFASLLIALIIGASPVAAHKQIGTTENTGFHSLTDTRSHPGADCVYRFFDQGTQWKLRRITVGPPNVRASQSNPSNQHVGWNFTVQRQYADAFHEQPGPWEHRYTSPTQNAMTDADEYASFTPMGVSVRVPDNASSDVWYRYRVIVKALWYRDNGTVSGTATMRVEWFKSHFASDTAKQRWSCRSNFFQPPG